MILQEAINKHKIRITSFILFSIIFFLFGCTAKIECTDLNSQPENTHNELFAVLGQWTVAEYIGNYVEYHEATTKTKEQEIEEEKFVSEIKKKYLEKIIEINSEKVVSFSPPTELGYCYSNWGDLFDIYRQPPDIWDGASLPFLCLSIQHKDFSGDTLDFIVDNNDNLTLFVNGLFFRLEKAN